MMPNAQRRGLESVWISGLLAVISGIALPQWRASAQGTVADYERSESLRERMAGKVFNEDLRVNWFGGGQFCWYLSEVRGIREFVLIDAESGHRSPAFDHRALAAALAAASGSEVDPERLPFDRIRFLEDRPGIAFRFEDADWVFEFESGRCLRLEGDATAGGEPGDEAAREGRRGRGRRGDADGREARDGTQEVMSPDGRWAAFIRDHNVFARSAEDGESLQLSQDGSEDAPYIMPLLWAPDSRKLAAYRLKRGKDRLVHYVDSTPDDQLQPTHFTRVYAKPGDEIDVREPRILFADWSGRNLQADPALTANPFTTRGLRWREDGSGVHFEHVERGMGVHRVLEILADSGETRILIDETSDTFIDIFHKGVRHDVGDTDEIIWASERDGWNHLYLFDGRTGELKNQITRGEWLVRGVEWVDEENRTICFTASGREAGQDVYFIHCYRINFDGTGLVRLTDGNGTHEVRFSPDRRFLVDSWSRVDQPPVHDLRRVEDGSLVCRLEEADAADLFAAGWKAPEAFIGKGRDGRFDIYGLIFRPFNFDPARRYPVIEHIYAGPQGAFVPKSFRAYHGMQAMAELGFIVVKIDGRGTSHRSREFHHFCYRNLADAGFPDRIAWMRAAAAKEPAMDLDRVGVYGGSAGGQNALGALLFHGEFYKAAAADCGCHDNRMDKLWWNEQWMDWPVDKHYEEQSNTTNARRLEGKLLLTVGELDTNVDPASTLQVVDALIKAGKDFEFLLFPGANHGVGESPYAARRRADFFVRHLLGVEPRAR